MVAFARGVAGEETNESVEIEELMRQRTITILDGLIAGTFQMADIAGIDNEILLMYDPQRYMGMDSVEVKYLKGMESAMAAIGRFLGYDPATFSTLRFFQSLEMLHESAKKNKQ